MTTQTDSAEARPTWFVNASEDSGDLSRSFIQEGIWRNGYTDRYLDRVREVQPGDRIAIKTRFNQKYNLPFDNRGHIVATMSIKATGTVIENLGDGRRLTVDWTPVEPPREWYFYTYAKTIWKVTPGDPYSDALIRFTFDGEEQDIDRFRNDPYWRDRFGDNAPDSEPPPDDEPEPPPELPYTLEDIIDDGCFLERSKLKVMLSRLRVMKNLILQGPPGTGKTWLAKRLAFALIGRRDERRVRRFQFHPNLSYEDFVRGYRPGSDGRLTLTDGPFLSVIEEARQDLDNDYVMVIEEVNRGNPAQTFGEMLTLMEANKRSAEDALALAYPRSPEERVHVPPNVYLIGTMNVADRSIAMVDFALRRRFAFVDLEPTFGAVWRDWVADNCGVGRDFLQTVESRITALNRQISNDQALGPQFRIGHSFVTPQPGATIGNPTEWFEQIVETDIAPLLDEYWFDEAQKVADAKNELLAVP